jgi:hypothetical protein
MKPMHILRPLTLAAIFCGLLPALAQTPPAAPKGPADLPPIPESDAGQAGPLEQQLESLAQAIDSLAQRYGELAEQHIGRLERSLSRLPETLDFGFGNLAAPEPPPAPIPPLGTRSSVPVLILQSSETAPEDQTALREDLLVMARVLERAAGGTRGSPPPVRAMGVELLSLHSGGQPGRTVYLEDYGALFALQVPFPLASGPRVTPSWLDSWRSRQSWVPEISPRNNCPYGARCPGPRPEIRRGIRVENAGRPRPGRRRRVRPRSGPGR